MGNCWTSLSASKNPTFWVKFRPLQQTKCLHDDEIHGEAGTPHFGGHFYGHSGPARTGTEHLRADGPRLLLPAPPVSTPPDTYKPVTPLQNNQWAHSSLVTTSSSDKHSSGHHRIHWIFNNQRQSCSCAGLKVQSPTPINITPTYC